jgi:hypothetical protein
VKKFFALLAILFVAVILAGCTSAPIERDGRYPWQVVLVIEYTMEDDEIKQEELRFETYAKYLEFFGIEPILNPVKVIEHKTLFFYEDTIKFQNPWHGITNHAKVTAMLDEVDFVSVDFIYVLESRARLSRAEGSFNYENEFTSHHYFFKSDVEEIVLLYRGPNPPIWYVIGIGLTFVFIGVTFVALTLVNRRKVIVQ